MEYDAQHSMNGGNGAHGMNTMSVICGMNGAYRDAVTLYLAFNQLVL